MAQEAPAYAAHERQHPEDYCRERHGVLAGEICISAAPEPEGEYDQQLAQRDQRCGRDYAEKDTGHNSDSIALSVEPTLENVDIILHLLFEIEQVPHAVKGEEFAPHPSEHGAAPAAEHIVVSERGH